MTENGDSGANGTSSLVNRVNLIDETSHSTSETIGIDPSADKDNDMDGEKKSDSSDDGDDYDYDKIVKKRAALRLRTLIDSDSDDDSSKKNYSVTIGSSTKEFSPLKSTGKSRLRINSDSSNESPKKNNNNRDDGNSSDNLEAINKSKRLNDLVDSDSDEEIVNKSLGRSNLGFDNQQEEEEERGGAKKTKKKEKKRTGSKRSAKDEAMRQIHSETQRLLREAPVSLPYHRPKQRTLEEFLNRKKIAPVLPQAMTTFAKMKMSAEIVSRALEEKEREAEIFYKSSDSEDDADTDAGTNATSAVAETGPGADAGPGTGAEVSADSQVSNEEKSSGNDIIKEAVKQVTRQLFNDESSDSFELKSQSTDSADVNPTPETEKLSNASSCEVDANNIVEKVTDDDLDKNTGLPVERNEFSSLESNDPAISSAVHTISNAISTSSTELESDIIISSAENDKTEADNNSYNDDLEMSQTKDLNSVQSDKSDGKELDKCEDLTAGLLSTDENVKSNGVQSVSLNPSSSESSISKTSIIYNTDDEFSGDGMSQSGGNPDVVGLPPPVFDDMETSKNSSALTNNVSAVDKKKTLMSVAELKPKIRGIPGMVIDFTQQVKPNKEAVDSLVDRFLSRHSASKHSDVKSEVTVLQTEATATGLKVTKDTLSYKHTADNIDDPELSKPGAKLVRLKEDLKKKMASKRNEEWKQKEQESLVDEEEEEEEEEGDGEKDAGEKEELMEVDEEEEELEEDDVPMKDKRKSCAFGDDEAEVSDEDDIPLSDDEEEEEEEEGDDDEEEENKKEENTQGRKRFSRIVAADEDSNSDTENPKTEKNLIERTKTDVDIFDDDDDDDDIELPAGQTNPSPAYKSPLTPYSRGTPFSVFGNKSTQEMSESPVRSLPSQLSWDIDSTPGAINESTGKLFEVQSKPVTDEELMNLCSGKFTDANNSAEAGNPRLSGLIDSGRNEKPITDSQIINLCSGTFATPDYGSQSVINNIEESSQDMCLRFDENSQTGVEEGTKKKLEEVEKVEKTESAWKSLKIVSSSSENEDQDEVDGENKNKKKVLKKRKVNKLVLSDDEDEDDDDNFSDEEQDAGDQSEEEKFIDYDSEENEVVVVPKREIKKVAANFLEAEAELSESEWGSEDEDEKDLDKLELEEGDAEDIDEDQMRDQLGKMHARQVLDDDQRDVRMLQELLFEDGDLHTDGAGRERRFKWKNIDKLGDDLLGGPRNDEDDDDNPADPTELANEIEWRKMRLEREKFMEEKMKSADDLLENELGTGGQFFKLGMKVLKKKKACIEQQSVEIVAQKPIIPRAVTELMGTPVSEKSKLLHVSKKKFNNLFN